ncbi:hypothetical protein BU23DRAFT_170537 [Bimuria novae-zelandiae CBS 107.79]|uniref:Uncharacterized protein n=1 Tax=Bimuria novae-zelandiae CBS 107.79 TaxID=1447943 RepID=A0A6A5V4D7_9PLEO|nr:hypothetical protein BU23DRAFT_170537 [Bimuria novae-zelandiae CBS 107.79]
MVSRPPVKRAKPDPAETRTAAPPTDAPLKACTYICAGWSDRHIGGANSMLGVFCGKDVELTMDPVMGMWEPVRCRECGSRVMWKKRTGRMVQFEAR